MKYCLVARQKEEYLQKADEIKMSFKDKKALPDFFEKYKNATFILTHYYNDEPIDWKEISDFNILSKGKFILCVDSIMEGLRAKKNGIKFYHSGYVKTFYELRALKDLGVEYAYIDAPLFFQMEECKKIGVPLRITPNLAAKDGLEREDGVLGSWIRPEDIDLYEEYISALEFDDFTLDRTAYYDKERALYRIYSSQKEWAGQLGEIITGLNYIGENHLLSSGLTKTRMNCGQRCMEGRSCKLCYRSLDTANSDKIINYFKETEKI